MALLPMYTLAIAVLIVLWRREYGPRSLRHIPVVGSSRVPVLSYAGALRYLLRAKEVLSEGYAKYPSGLFRVAQLDQWAVVVTSQKLMEEIRQFPQEKMSVAHGLGEFIAVTYTFGEDFLVSPHSVNSIHQYLGRHLGERISAIQNEMHAALKDVSHADQTEGWMEVPGFDFVLNIVARATNRVFVGLPTCRDQGFLNIATDVAISVIKVRTVLGFFPSSLKPLLAPLISPTPANIKRCKPYVSHIIRERMRLVAEGQVRRQECLLHTLVDDLAPLGYQEDDIIRALFVLFFASLHSTTICFTHALYEVVAHPEYAKVLREEAERVFRQAGSTWTKDAIGQLRGTDSLLKEAQRFCGPNANSLVRKAMTDVTLSDGTFIPIGTFVVGAARHVHLKEESYASPNVFNPWRFVQEDGADSSAQSLSTPRGDYLTFGLGKYACPGRFFAAVEMKMLLAELVMQYDLQFANGGPRPTESWIGASIIPDRTAKIYLRRRT